MHATANPCNGHPPVRYSLRASSGMSLGADRRGCSAKEEEGEAEDRKDAGERKAEMRRRLSLTVLTLRARLVLLLLLPGEAGPTTSLTLLALFLAAAGPVLAASERVVGLAVRGCCFGGGRR